jgi:hypothetical protein
MKVGCAQFQLSLFFVFKQNYYWQAKCVGAMARARAQNRRPTASFKDIRQHLMGAARGEWREGMAGLLRGAKSRCVASHVPLGFAQSGHSDTEYLSTLYRVF